MSYKLIEDKTIEELELRLITIESENYNVKISVSWTGGNILISGKATALKNSGCMNFEWHPDLGTTIDDNSEFWMLSLKDIPKVIKRLQNTAAEMKAFEEFAKTLNIN